MEYVGDELEIFQLAVNWRNYWQSEVIQMLSALPNEAESVLEVGSGMGTVTADLAPRFAQWLALEPDQNLSEIATSRLGSDGGLEHVVGMLLDLPADRNFDLVLYVDVLEHIEDDTAELSQAGQRVRHDGGIIVVAPAHDFLYSPFDKSIGHIRRYDRKKLEALCPDGFRVGATKYLDSAGLLANLLNRLLLRQSLPKVGQIKFWDRCMVPLSRQLDRLTRYRLGKTVVVFYLKNET